MIWLGLALALFAIALAGLAWSRRHARRIVDVVVPEDLVARVERASGAVVAAPPWQPSAVADAPEAAAAIEAALIAGDRGRALELAEAMLAAAPDRPASRTWLAWALVANGQPAAALDQLAPSSRPDELTDYLRARAEHLRFEHAAGAREPIPPLVTTADLAVVTLASGRGAATWLHGATEAQLPAQAVRAAIAEHRELTARCLARALGALEAQPGFADAAYLVARLAVKAGLIAQGRALFDALVPAMQARPERAAFERDRRDLADPASAVAAAKQAPVPGPARRSRSLKVLS